MPTLLVLTGHISYYYYYTLDRRFTSTGCAENGHRTFGLIAAFRTAGGLNWPTFIQPVAFRESGAGGHSLGKWNPRGVKLKSPVAFLYSTYHLQQLNNKYFYMIPSLSFGLGMCHLPQASDLQHNYPFYIPPSIQTCHTNAKCRPKQFTQTTSSMACPNFLIMYKASLPSLQVQMAFLANTCSKS
jgi:hypothetical protein